MYWLDQKVQAFNGFPPNKQGFSESTYIYNLKAKEFLVLATEKADTLG